MKVPCVAKAHVSGLSLGAAASAALAAGVAMVSILQEGDCARVSMPARHYFSTYITAATTDQHQASLQNVLMGLSE